MRALALKGPRDLEVIDTRDPEPGRGEVLVRVRACGLCGSDLNAWRGAPGIQYPLPPGAPGHEALGEVAALGPEVSRLSVGQQVTGLMSNGYAELSLARACELVPVASPVLGEPLACAMNVVRRSGLQKGDRVAVVGFGYLASLIVQLLPLDISGWVAVSRRADSRSLACELGAEAAYAGRLVIAGYHADGPRTVNMQSWNWKGIDVINAHERDPRRYVSGLREALGLVHARQLVLGRLITSTWPLARAAEAFEALDARPPGFVKAIVEP